MKQWFVNGSLFFALCACANDTSFSIPEILCDDNALETTHTMEQIKGPTSTEAGRCPPKSTDARRSKPKSTDVELSQPMYTAAEACRM